MKAGLPLAIKDRGGRIPDDSVGLTGRFSGGRVSSLANADL